MTGQRTHAQQHIEDAECYCPEEAESCPSVGEGPTHDAQQHVKDDHDEGVVGNEPRRGRWRGHAQLDVSEGLIWMTAR